MSDMSDSTLPAQLPAGVLQALLEFRRERDWEQFHNPRTLSTALSIETSELLEHFRWAKDADLESIVAREHTALRHELADIAILLSYLCHDLGISLEDAVREKLEINRQKYPVDKAKGSSLKYDQLR